MKIRGDEMWLGRPKAIKKVTTAKRKIINITITRVFVVFVRQRSGGESPRVFTHFSQHAREPVDRRRPTVETRK